MEISYAPYMELLTMLMHVVMYLSSHDYKSHLCERGILVLSAHRGQS